MRAGGMSVRQIMRASGRDRKTISNYIDITTSDKPKVRKSGPNLCDECGGEISTEREFNRRTRRTRHKFCCHGCFCDFYRKQRENDQCKRCGVKRKEILCCVFSRGYCQRCYAIMRTFSFNEELAATHDLTMQLKKELRNGQ